MDEFRGNDSPRSTIDIVLDNPVVRLRTAGTDVEPAILSGHVSVFLTESTSLKEVKLSFKGKARFSDRTMTNRTALKYTLFTHRWSFLHGNRQEHKLSAGHHRFPFHLPVDESFPSSLDSPAASIIYKLRARAIKPGLSNIYSHHPLHVTVDVPILRSYRSEAMEYQNTLDVENSWPGKLAYSVMIPHKAWAAGDKLSALVKFSPLVKGVRVLSIESSISEKIKIVPRGVCAYVHPMQTVAEVRHNIVNGQAIRVNSRTCLHPTFSSSGPFTDSPPSFPLNNCAHRTFNVSSSSETASDSSDDATMGMTSDLATFISIDLPSTLTPSHPVKPVVVSHKLFLNVLISNPDGTRSELRCFFPLRILDHHLLNEARTFSAPSRRVFLGASDESALSSSGDNCWLEEDALLLPSYGEHVQDLVANVNVPELATNPSYPASFVTLTRRRHSRSQSRQSSLPRNRDWTSLWFGLVKTYGNQRPRSLSLSLVPTLCSEAETVTDKLGWWSRSFFSNDRSCQARREMIVVPPPSLNQQSLSSRPGTSHSCSTMAESESEEGTESPSWSSSCTEMGEIIRQWWSATPEYAVASRVGVVPPLSSMAGLPSYEESMSTV